MMHGFMGRCWKWCHNKSIGLLLLRLALGAYFLGHGIAKLESMSSTVAMFNAWGFPSFLAYLETIAEVLAGVAIMLGAFMWIAAALIAVIMLVAVYTVIGPNPQGEPWLFHFIFGWGPNAIYAAAALALAFTGAGKWSLTNWWMRRKDVMACKQCMMDHGARCTCADPHTPDCICRLCGCGK